LDAQLALPCVKQQQDEMLYILADCCAPSAGSIRVTATCTGGFAQPFLRSTFNVTLLAPTAAECRALPNYRCASAAAKA
jgi:hypothetical protein